MRSWFLVVILAIILPVVTLFAIGGAAAHDPKHHAPVPKKSQAVTTAPSTGGAPPASPFPALSLNVGGPFALIDQNGQARSDEDFRGSYMLVFFGYANCEGICPVGLRSMTEALDGLGAQGARVQPILITIDPENDTVAALHDAVAKIHPRLLGLTGSGEALNAVAKAYNIDSKSLGKSLLTGKPVFSHSSFVYLMGPDGKFLTLFPPIMAPDAMTTAIQGYIAGAS